MFGVAAALEEGVDVGSNLGERAGDGGDDAGFVVDDEAQVVGGYGVAGDGFGDGGERDAAGRLARRRGGRT